MDQPAQWIYDTLRLAASPYTCVSYQIWQHGAASSAPSTHTGSHKSSPYSSSFCIASGLSACHFMWYSAPLRHDQEVPGVQKTILGGRSNWGSPTKGSSNTAKQAVSASAL